MLAQNPEAAEAVIARGLSPRTSKTIVDERAFRRELQRVRETGMATSYGEALPQRSCVAVALRDEAGRPIAALSVGGTAGIFDCRRQADLLRSIAAEAQRAARQATRVV
jgi:DNA-binding IclR family transcriptional regulator